MLKAEEFSSAITEYVDSKDFEFVNAKAEKNSLSNFKTLTRVYGTTIEEKVKAALSAKFETFNYKILVVGDEHPESENSKIKKIIILLEDDEKKACVMDSITEENVEYGVLQEIPSNKKTTVFKKNCSKWCDCIQDYLANTFDFKGTTKVRASAYNGNMVTFDIVVSRKGTTDTIVKAMREIAKAMNDISLTLTENEIFTFIDNYFKAN